MTIIRIAIALLLLGWAPPVLSQESCNESSLQACVDSCASSSGDSCLFQTFTKNSLSDNVRRGCCNLKSKRARKRCVQRFVKLSRSRNFKNLLGSVAASKLKADLVTLKSEDCAPVSTSGFLSGSSEPLSPQFARPSLSCTSAQDEANFPYEATQIAVTTTGNYAIDFTFGTCQGIALIYEDSFDPAQPTNNCGSFAMTGDVENGSSSTQIQRLLEAGKVYVVVVTTGNNINNCTYSFSFSSPTV